MGQEREKERGRIVCGTGKERAGPTGYAGEEGV